MLCNKLIIYTIISCTVIRSLDGLALVLSKMTERLCLCYEQHATNLISDETESSQVTLNNFHRSVVLCMFVYFVTNVLHT